MSVIVTVLCLLLYHTNFATYNNILVKSINQFLQCICIIIIYIVCCFICSMTIELLFLMLLIVEILRLLKLYYQQELTLTFVQV